MVGPRQLRDATFTLEPQGRSGLQWGVFPTGWRPVPVHRALLTAAAAQLTGEFMFLAAVLQNKVPSVFHAPQIILLIMRVQN